MGGGSGGGNTTTTTKADPWAGVQPYLAQAYSQANNLYQPGAGPAYYPGQTTPDTTWQTTAGLTDIANTALSQGKNLGNEAYYNQYRMGLAANNGIGIGYDALGKGNAGVYDLAGQLNGGSYGAAGAMNQLGAAGQGMSGQGSTAIGQGMSGLYDLAGQLNGGSYLTADAAHQLNQAGDFQNNPAFQAALSSAIRPVTQNFQEQVMPAIQQGAQAAGQMGGSRQGIAEGIAARGYQDTVGDISANMGNAAYAQGLQALQASGQLGQGMTGQQGSFLSGLGSLGSNVYGQGLQATQGAGQLGMGMAGLQGSLLGGLSSTGANMYGQGLTGLGQNQALTGAVQQAGLAPGQAVAGVGAQYEQMQQQQLDAAQQKYNYQQNLPYTMISDYLAMLNGAQGGATTAQQSGGGGSRMTGALGGAATGAAIGSAFAPGMGTAIGAGAGALYGLFM